ncbi:MAG TPA: LysR family transcriptional regulator, partial [Candidatus Avacidaminococcus intestinavium]|nr:LysR family transcriptional regulator [Candidatus Avacidaminococcus intestinavium]
HRLYKKTKIDLYDLRDEEFLVREKGSGTRVLF